MQCEHLHTILYNPFFIGVCVCVCVGQCERTIKQFCNIWGMHSCLRRLTHIAVADPDGELSIPKVWAPSYFLAIFCLNLHQIEKKNGQIGGRASLVPPPLPRSIKCIIYLLVEGDTQFFHCCVLLQMLHREGETIQLV